MGPAGKLTSSQATRDPPQKIELRQAAEARPGRQHVTRSLFEPNYDIYHHEAAAGADAPKTQEAEAKEEEEAAAAAITAEEEKPTEVTLNDFVGEHGGYQLAITTLLFIRYVLLGLMANSGPLMTPDVTFYCQLPMDEVLLIMPNISTLGAREQQLEIEEEFKQVCQIDLHLYQNYTQLSNLTHTKSQAKTTPLIVAAGQQRQQQVAKSLNHSNIFVSEFPNTPLNETTSTTILRNLSDSDRIRECTDFTYQLAPDQGLTMTNEFDLVCERDYLRSLFQSLVSASIVVAHVFWGTFSDKYGRFQAQRICLAISLVSGLFSIFALDFWTFTLARALCSFGDLGMVVSLTTTVVELVGSRYRGLSVALVNFGYALGVSMLPYVVAYFENFRWVIGFTVFCHALTMPFVLATNESVRWLLTNRRFKKARRELKRISRWNRSCSRSWESLCGPFRKQVLVASKPPEGTTGSGGSRVKKKDPQFRELRRQQKEAFELLFKEFVDQMESQNLCDPSLCAKCGDQAARTPSSSAKPRHPLGLPTISIDRHHDNCDNSESGQPNGFDVRCGSSRAERGRPIFSDIYAHSGASSRASSVSSYRSPSLARSSLSCNYIDQPAGHCDAALEWEPLRGQLAAPPPLATIESRRQQLLEAKLKTLTLPLAALSRESSLCGAEGESIETHLRLRAAAAEPKRQPDCINLVAHQLSFVGRVNRLFRDKKLMICVFTIVWTTFNSELLYTSFIIIDLEVGEDVYLNYVLGGCMEALAAIMASLLLSYAPRRVSLIAFWLLISFSCFGLSLAHIDSHWAVWMLALAKFSQSSLSSIASVAAYESFPTFLRQSGSGLVFTLGMLGSVFAPLIFAEFDDHAGMDRVLMTFSFSSLTAAILIYLYLNETRDCELQ